MTPLPPDRWPEVERLFAAACDSADADALLDAADPAVAAEVRALLAADHNATLSGAPLADLVTLFAEASRDLLPDDDAGLAPGTRVGPWAVEDEIGSGGMGVVYRARRADGVYDEAVALKVVRRGMDSAQVVRRFAQERAVLASLDHAGIARLLDGGTTPDGRPFLVLDLVPGEPITSWADHRHATVEQRVCLVVQVCEAVAHAHRRLVVHRDLKPSNVLVADPEMPGGAPRVTLLDFGVAHLLRPDASAGTLTGDGPRPMTPEYAAPEQLAGEAVTTATDVYALGVVLYELLAGRRPHVSAGRAPTALAVAIRGAPPPRPSTAATRDAAPNTTSAAVARARASTPDRLRARLRGDLDAVVLKALRPEPEARYASVDALAEDLRRHLDGRPVLARGGGARYRAGRFVRRYRWGVASLVAFLFMAAAVVALVVVQNHRVTRERDSAREIAAVLESVFLDIDPGGPSGAPESLRSLLASGTARVEALDASPDAQAHLLDVLARVYRALADYDRALPLHRAAVAAARRAHGPDSPEVLLARHHLAYLLEQMGQVAEAEQIYRAVLAARQRSGDADGLVESLGDLAGLVLGQDRPAAAAALARDGLAVLARHPDAGPPDLGGPLARAGFLTILARTDEAVGRLDSAEARLRTTLAIYRRVRGAEHTYTATAETSLGRLLARRGRPAEADSLLRHALSVQTHAWGPTHPWTTATLTSYAEVRARAGDARAARRLLAEARTRASADSTSAADIERRAVRVEAVLAGQPDRVAARVSARP